MPDDPAAPADQAEVVRALEDGTAAGGARLKRIDTHMSHLFLGPSKVYKLKQQRRHPFADMSTLEARRLSCEAELAVNKALAPDLYEAVVPVVRTADGAITLGGQGQVLDWVVVMRRFPDGALLDEIAQAGRLTPDQIQEAAEVVAAFHARLPAREDVGHGVDYRRILAGLRQTEAQAAAALGILPGSESLFAALDHELARLTPLIEARRRAGWVRRGHGDLHLRNICLSQGRVTPFDALEFDPALATADVLYDAAFLFMDLRARGLGDLANLAMNRYWDAAEQPESGLALLPLFMALRAAIRMAVAVEAGDLAQADRYRRLGRDLLAHAPARLVAIGGLSGTGKSTLAHALAPRLPGPCGARLLRTDLLRKALAGVEPTARLSEEAYRQVGRANVYQVLARRAGEALAAGACVIADATYREDAPRAQIEAAAGSCVFTGLWLQAPTAVRVARVAGRHGDASDATPEIAAAQAEPKALSPAWRVLDAGQEVEALVAESLRP